jgi:plasmid stabilization system protein ParE
MPSFRKQRIITRTKIRLGLQFVSAVETLLDRIRVNPLRFPPIEKTIRKGRLVRFPYGIIYRIRPKDIQIIAVMHLKREPNYWRNRLRDDA